MLGRLETSEARAMATELDGGLEVALGGTWQITAPRPAWTRVLANRKPARVKVRVDDVDRWDTSLLLFLFEIQEWCRIETAYCDTDALPEKIRTLLAQFRSAHETAVPFDRSDSFLTGVGRTTLDTWQRGRAASAFLGESVIAFAKLVRRPHKFRWGDCFDEMQQCGAMALPIVSLISFLVGLIMA
jgi:phospholipid/cholesterol/gamma-HCH transport system permease protein